MPQVQKNLINFLRKNIVLTIAILILATSFISVSAMEIVAPDEFKPSTGVQKILHLDNKKSESQIANLDEVESESSLVTSVSASVVSSFSQEKDGEEGSSKDIIGKSSSVSSSSKISSYSAKSSTSTTSSSTITESSASVKSSLSKTSVQPVIKTQGSPLCRINEEKPEAAGNQQSLKDRGFNFKIVRFLYHKDSSSIKADKSWSKNDGGDIYCYSTEKIDRHLSKFQKPYEDCTQDEREKLFKLLSMNDDNTFVCNVENKERKDDLVFLEFALYNPDMNDLYILTIRDIDKFDNVNIVEYPCYFNSRWVPRILENDHKCASNFE